MKLITQYNQLIEEIVWNWYKRYSKEIYEQEEDLYKTDYRIMDHYKVNEWPVEINDRFFSLNDILLCEAYNIPCKYLQDYYDEDLEAHMKDETLGINFYNYWMKNKNPKEYSKQENKELKESKERVKKAKDLFLKTFKYDRNTTKWL